MWSKTLFRSPGILYWNRPPQANPIFSREDRGLKEECKEADVDPSPKFVGLAEEENVPPMEDLNEGEEVDAPPPPKDVVSRTQKGQVRRVGTNTTFLKKEIRPVAEEGRRCTYVLEGEVAGLKDKVYQLQEDVLRNDERIRSCEEHLRLAERRPFT